MKKRVVFGLPAGLLALAVGVALAVSIGGYTKTGTSKVGIVVAVYNSIDSTILDGTLLMIDTTTTATTNLDRVVVKPWSGTVLDRWRFVGIADGNIPARSTNGVGSCLIWGFHNAARVQAAATAGGSIKPAGVWGHFAVAANTDSSALPIGYFIGYTAGLSGSRGRVFLNHIGAQHNSAIH